MAHRPDSRRGFTLVELLVTIGLIALLISILVPTAVYIREQGYKTKTTAHLNNLRAAVEAYYGTFHSYPGPLSESQLINGNNLPANVTSRPTGAENLVLGLLGGLTLDNGVIAYEKALVGSGPASFIKRGNLILLGKSSSPFVQSSSDVLSPNGGQPCPFPGLDVKTGHFDDSNIPEFVDAYPESMPILYLRARQGAPDVVLDPDKSNPPPAQYDIRVINAYTAAAYAKGQPGLISYGSPGSGYVSPATSDGPYNGISYLGDPQTAGSGFPQSPRAKDTFILIAAGSDRLYGTKDDVTSFGSVKP